MLFNVVLLLASLLLISHFSRVFEHVLVGAHVPGILCSLGCLAMLISGSLARLRSTIGFAVTIYFLWMLACTPFSTWKGGSAQYVLWYGIYWIVLMLLIANGPRSAKDLIRLAWITVGACLFFLLTGSQMTFGRLAVNTTFGNSDDVALMGGFALTLLIMGVYAMRNQFLRYSLLLTIGGYFLVTIGRTGTRTAILGGAGMVGIFVLRARMTQKIAILAASAVALVGLVLVLPSSTLNRFVTIVDSFDADKVASQVSTSEAMASTAERRDLLNDAIKMVKDNPIFGVGPGEYPDYRYNFLRDATGKPKRFFPSHNTYAQIAAESGIPGLLLYILFLFVIFVTLMRNRRLALQSRHPDTKTIQVICLALEANWIYFAICAMFMTCDRHPHQFVIAGMALACERLLTHWVSQQQQRPTAAAFPQPKTFRAFPAAAPAMR